jgi:hypothetical protein
VLLGEIDEEHHIKKNKHKRAESDITSSLAAQGNFDANFEQSLAKPSASVICGNCHQAY